MAVPNAIPGRESIDVEIFGMEGIPYQDLERHNEQKEKEFGAKSKKQKVVERDPDAIKAQFAAFQAMQANPSQIVSAPSVAAFLAGPTVPISIMAMDFPSVIPPFTPSLPFTSTPSFPPGFPAPPSFFPPPGVEAVPIPMTTGIGMPPFMPGLKSY